MKTFFVLLQGTTIVSTIPFSVGTIELSLMLCIFAYDYFDNVNVNDNVNENNQLILYLTTFVCTFYV